MKATVIALLCVFSYGAQAQTATLVNHLTVDEVYDLLTGFGVSENMVDLYYEVDFYRVEYRTIHPNGDSVDVTGALCLPSNIDCPLPLSSYQHGTVALKTNVPSYQNFESNLGLLYASAGYASVMPDYIGLGDSPGMHLYVHADSQADAALDLIRATYDLQESLDFELNDQLFLWGYSQGGHATMALHRLIETEYSDEFTVTGCAPMSGPYDISGAQAEVLTSDQPYPTPGYMPYVILSYQEAYGNLYTDLEEIFLPEYAAIIPDLFDGDNSMGFINSQFPDVPSEMLLPEVLEAFESDPEHPLRFALADNDVYDWAPTAPTHLYYCNGDDQVTYQNSVVALEAMINNGSTSVEAFDGGPFDHSVCAPFAMLAGYNFFEGLREAPFAPQYEAVIIPSSVSDGSIEVIFDDPDPEWTYSWSTGDEGTSIDGLEAGTYTLTVSNGVCAMMIDLEVLEAVGIIEVRDVAHDLLYPNPTEGLLNSRVSGNMVIYDLQGKEVYSSRVQAGGSIDLSALSEGVYIAVVNGEHTVRLVVF